MLASTQDVEAQIARCFADPWPGVVPFDLFQISPDAQQDFLAYVLRVRAIAEKIKGMRIDPFLMRVYQYFESQSFHAFAEFWVPAV